MTKFIASNAWICGIFLGGYLIRWSQSLYGQWYQEYKVKRTEKLRAWERSEVRRMLDGFEELTESKRNSGPHVAVSPLARWNELDVDSQIPSTVWDRAGYLRSDDEEAWINAPGRTWRQWWVDWKEATKPRTPEQVATRVYEEVVLEGGELYQGRHRVDGYTEREVACLNTHTAEFPSLRHLRTNWKHNSAPVPAEVLT